MKILLDKTEELKTRNCIIDSYESYGFPIDNGREIICKYKDIPSIPLLCKNIIDNHIKRIYVQINQRSDYNLPSNAERETIIEIENDEIEMRPHMKYLSACYDRSEQIEFYTNEILYTIKTYGYKGNLTKWVKSNGKITIPLYQYVLDAWIKTPHIDALKNKVFKELC